MTLRPRNKWDCHAANYLDLSPQRTYWGFEKVGVESTVVGKPRSKVIANICIQESCNHECLSLAGSYQDAMLSI